MLPIIPLLCGLFFTLHQHTTISIYLFDAYLGTHMSRHVFFIIFGDNILFHSFYLYIEYFPARQFLGANTETLSLFYFVFINFHAVSYHHQNNTTILLPS